MVDIDLRKDLVKLTAALSSYLLVTTNYDIYSSSEGEKLMTILNDIDTNYSHYLSPSDR